MKDLTRTDVRKLRKAAAAFRKVVQEVFGDSNRFNLDVEQFDMELRHKGETYGGPIDEDWMKVE